jgi:peptidoglycan hydrolase-like protein with peptidoglycan-binding domain
MTYVPPPTIKIHSQGLNVAYCQNLLNSRIPVGKPLWVDGIFGQNTDARVRQFQRIKPNLAVDGVVGPETWAALEAGPPPIKKRPAKQIVVPATAGA